MTKIDNPFLAYCDIGKTYGDFGKETITITIHAYDVRIDADSESKVRTFVESARGFFPDIREGKEEYRAVVSRTWNKIEGWLEDMKVDPHCQGYVIDNILKCSSYQRFDGWCLSLLVNLQIFDGRLGIPKLKSD